MKTLFILKWILIGLSAIAPFVFAFANFGSSNSRGIEEAGNYGVVAKNVTEYKGSGIPELNPVCIGSALVLVVGGTLAITGRKTRKIP